MFTLSFLANVAGYVARTVLARNLETAQFGLFYAVYAFIMFLTLFAYFGFAMTLVKYVAEFKTRKQYDKLTFAVLFPAFVMISLSIVISVILFLSSNFLAMSYFKSPEALLVVRIFSITLILMVISHTLLSIFRGFQDFLFAALITFLEKFSFAILVALFLLLGFVKNPYLPAYAILFAVLLTVIIFFPILFKYSRYFVKTKFFSDLAKSMRGFALATFLASLGILIIGYIDTLMLTYFRSLGEVGIYNVVLPTVMVLGIFTQSIRQVLAPMVTELWTKKLKKRLSNGIEVLRNYSLISIIPMALVLFVFPKIIINLLFGIKYVGGYLAMQILSIGVIFFTLGFIDLTTMRYIGRPKESTKIIFVGVVFNIITNLILIPRFGINGAAITTTLSYLLMMILASIKLGKFIELRSDVLFWFKLLFAAAIFVITVSVIKWLLNINQFLEAGICLVSAGIIYIIVCYVLKLIKIDEIKLFINNLILRNKRPAK